MNWNEREAIRERLMENLSCFMIQHGEIKKDRVIHIPALRWSSLPGAGRTS